MDRGGSRGRLAGNVIVVRRRTSTCVGSRYAIGRTMLVDSEAAQGRYTENQE